MKKQRIVGIDLGGTFIKFGLFSQDGTCLEKWQVPTGDTGLAHVCSTIAEEVTKHSQASGAAADEIAGIGMGVPGCVDRNGMLIHAPNLGWKMVNIGQEIRKHLDVPVFIVNDANAAALGEQSYGIGAGCESLVFVTLGTGVGGGIVVNGHLVQGRHGCGGELGHMIMNPQETEACGCGNHGCLEQYASATGIVRMAHALLETSKKESVLRTMDSITAKDVFDAVKENDALAVEVAENFGDRLGRALAMAAAVIDPEMFVIGGGVSAAGEVLLSYVQKAYVKYAFSAGREAVFRIASLGNDAGIYGAARLVQLEQ